MSASICLKRALNIVNYHSEIFKEASQHRVLQTIVTFWLQEKQCSLFFSGNNEKKFNLATLLGRLVLDGGWLLCVN